MDTVVYIQLSLPAFEPLWNCSRLIPFEYIVFFRVKLYIPRRNGPHVQQMQDNWICLFRFFLSLSLSLLPFFCWIATVKYAKHIWSLVIKHFRQFEALIERAIFLDFFQTFHFNSIFVRGMLFWSKNLLHVTFDGVADFVNVGTCQRFLNICV